MPSKGKLILPSDIITQINFLHGKIGSIEWSGMLFYDVVKGNPSKPEDFVLKVKHIYLMDIGTGAYTEYETDGDFVEIYDEIEEAMNWKVGHIHSHHTMQTFFSGTDMDELHDNVDKHNYYLSLIVNHAGKYQAKIAFLSDIHSSAKMNFISDEGSVKHFKTQNIEKKMAVIDMDIYYEYADPIFYNRYNAILKKKEVAKKEKEVKEVQGNKWNRWDRKYSQMGELDFRALPKGKKIIEDVDPKDMTNLQIEKLARCIFAVDPELKETRTNYQILHLLANVKEEELEFYYDHLANNIESIIENFFDVELESNEMAIVLDEVKGSMIRFQNSPYIKNVVNGISETIDQFFMDFTKRVEETDMEEQLEKELEKELLEME
jgi:hypothetical protein